MLLSLSFLFALVSGALAAQCTSITQCYDSMRQTLNLQVAQPWSYPERFREEIELFYKSSDANGGLRKLCKAFRAYRTCVGSSYRSCMTPRMVAESGVVSKAAYEFVSVFSQLHYTCGAGVNVFVNNEACLQTIWGTHHGLLEKARLTYNVKVDEDRANTCVFAEKLLRSFSGTFLTKCNEIHQDVEFWGCEYARIYIFNRFPQCNNLCSTSTITVGGIAG